MRDIYDQEEGRYTSLRLNREYDVEIPRDYSGERAMEAPGPESFGRASKSSSMGYMYFAGRRGGSRPYGFSFIWKLLVVALLISNIGLWYAAGSVSDRLTEIKRAVELQAQYNNATLPIEGAAFSRDAAYGAEREPVEEDSILAWEQRQEMSAGLDSVIDESATEPYDQDGDSGSAKGAAVVKRVYLTFDDGPSKYTDEILDILGDYEVKATFFVVAKGKEVFEDKLRRIVEEGHTLGMHSYSHVYKDIYRSKEAFIQDVNSIQDYLHDVTGIYPDFFRFPGGSSTGLGAARMEELEGYLDEIGVDYFDWNVSSGDATGKLTADQIYQNSVRNLDKYDDVVILFHDAAEKRTTVEALPRIIEHIKSMENTVILPITKDSKPVKHR